MPLKCCKQTCEIYYTEHIKSDIVSDIIVEDRTEYPVIDLALDHLYDSAQQLLQKGYKCLHGDTAHISHEAALLLFEIATPHIRSLIHGDENLPDIEHALLSEMDERMQNNPDEYATFITLVVHSLSSINDISVSRYVIPYIREHMPEFYADFIALGDFDMETLLHLDSKFVEDYMDDLSERNMISQFTEENRIDADQATSMLYDIFDYMDLDTFDTLQPSLFAISQTCPGLFPDHFTCDVVILFMIGRFRDFSSGSDTLRNMFYEEDDLFLDEYDYDDKECIRHYMSLYFPLLHFHMKPGYTFDRVAHILITRKNPLTEIYLASDFALLDAAARYAANSLGVDKLPVSSSTLKTSIEERKIKLPVYAEESRPEYYDGKELLETYRPDAKEIASWFYDNCDVQ